MASEWQFIAFNYMGVLLVSNVMGKAPTPLDYGYHEGENCAEYRYDKRMPNGKNKKSREEELT